MRSMGFKTRKEAIDWALTEAERLKEEMTAFFNIVPEVPATARLWQQVAELAWSLDRTSGGHRPLTDILIARCAMQVGAVLISPDRHFEHIPGLKRREKL